MKTKLLLLGIVVFTNLIGYAQRPANNDCILTLDIRSNDTMAINTNRNDLKISNITSIINNTDPETSQGNRVYGEKSLSVHFICSKLI